MKRFALALALFGCSSSTPNSDSSASSSGTPGFVCQPAPSCGGTYVGAWTIDRGCSVAAVPLAGCGTFEVDFAAATGQLSFGADASYTANLDLGESAKVTIPASCAGVKSCDAFDTALLACTGEPASGCSCNGVVVNESGTYVEASGALALTAKSAPVLHTVASWCASDDSIELVVANAVVVGATKK